MQSPVEEVKKAATRFAEEAKSSDSASLADLVREPTWLKALHDEL